MGPKKAGERETATIGPRYVDECSIRIGVLPVGRVGMRPVLVMLNNGSRMAFALDDTADNRYSIYTQTDRHTAHGRDTDRRSRERRTTKEKSSA